MGRKKQDFGRKKDIGRELDGNHLEDLNANQQIIDDSQMDYMAEEQNETGQIIDQEDPIVNMHLIEDSSAQPSSSNTAIQQQHMDEDKDFQCSSSNLVEIESRKRKKLISEEDIDDTMYQQKKICSTIIDGSSDSDDNIKILAIDISGTATDGSDSESARDKRDNRDKRANSNSTLQTNNTLPTNKYTFKEYKREHKRIQRETQNEQDRQNEKERNLQIKRKERKKMSKYLWAADPDKATPYTLSAFEFLCPNCKAVHFIEEFKKYKGKTGYSGCCNYGDISNLDQTIDDYPPELRVLYDPDEDMHKAYIANIRKINSSFSFASLSCFNFTFPTPGPPLYKIQGQVYHKFNKVAQPLENEKPTNGQLYFLDPSEVYQERMNVVENSHELMALIEVSLRDRNIFAHSFEMMKETCEREEQKAEAEGREVPNVNLLFSLKEGFDERRYNLPVSNDVYAIIVCNGDDEIIPANYVVTKKGKKNLTNLYALDPIVEPMTYPLFYPLGTRGWNYKILNRKHKKISLCDFVKYRLYYRDEKETGKFFPHHHSKKLFQQWVVDQYTRIEWERLLFFRSEHFQKNFAKTNYQNILDYMTKKANKDKDTNVEKKMVILPSSYSGSPRNMVEHYMDAMTIMTSVGFPDLFITFTCNPNDPDILKTLKPGETANDRPEMVARVFKLKKEQLIREIVEDGIFGQTACHVMTIEYQKRGLPHLHLIVTLTPEDKIRTKKQVDDFISAEIPDKKDSVLYDIVTQNMMHGPCTVESACWHKKKKKCSKHFPFAFNEETKLDQEGYATYKRTDNGRHVFKKGIRLTNQHVAPYNKYLLKRFLAHINVVKVASIKAVKYLYKYIYKGLDQATVECCTYDENGKKKILLYNEVNNFLDARCLSPVEACWRIFKFPSQFKSHSVMGLPIHLKGEKIVYFDPKGDDEEIERKMARKSPLEAYFAFLTQNPNLDFHETNGERFLYSQMPKYCTWDRDKGIWKYPRRGKYNSLGRVYPVNVKETDKYYLYYLLLNVSGTSFDDLKTFNGIPYDTYAQACLARGLCRDDAEWRNCLAEATICRMPKALRTLFVNILINCAPKYPEKLWEEFKDALSEDIKKKFPNLAPERIHQKALYLIDLDLRYQEKSLKDFASMPQEIDGSDKDDIEDDDFYDPAEELSLAEGYISLMNDGQKAIISELMDSIEKGLQKCVYTDGPGGTGKTFLLNAIYHLARAYGKKVTNMAFSGIAATSMKKGRTLHNVWKLPLDITSRSYSSIEINSKEAEKIKNTDIFIWDEAPMASKHIMKIMDKKLKEIMKNKKPFGGKSEFLSGDFRQVLPIKRNAARTEIVDLSIKNSPLWSLFTQRSLTENMRAGADEIEFAKDLLDIGNGISKEDGYIYVPEECICKNDLVDEIFGDIFKNENFTDLADRAILATLNSTVDNYNDKAIAAFPGPYFPSHFSFDETDPDNKYPISMEMLNASKATALPDHVLKLKKGCILMLIRNLNLKEGLCNTTRLQLVNATKNVLQCIIVTGDKKGETVFIPRITIIEDKKFPFILRRHQFPVKLAFSFTINKSQSQTFTKIGIDLENEVFAHGQCYVAFSRAKSWNGIKVKLDPENIEKKIKNVVWKEAL